MKTAVATYRECTQAARRWQAWVYRHAWRSAFLVLLVLSLIEPLGCLAHCQLWLSFTGTTVTSAQQMHSHNHNAGIAEGRATVFADSRAMPHDRSAPEAAPLATVLGAPAHLRTVDLAPQGSCLLNRGTNIPWRSTNESSSAPPHEHLAALMIFMCLALVLLVQHVTRGFPPAAPLPAYRPLLRPPILLTA